MESQESDICNAEEMDMLLNYPDVGDLMETVDWSSVSVPLMNPTGELPARNEWQGEYFFDAKVDLTGVHKKHYVVSSKLNKLYVDMDKVVPFQIHWDGTPGLYVRALMMFTLADHMKNPVKRCITHKDKDNPMNTHYEHSEHVLATGNDNAEYNMDQQSKRYSVKVPLHLQQGCNYALVNYKFMCKTSCTGGLNRSPTDVIFTLEDAGGTVYGRQIIAVKICSCPKRDKEKDEANMAEPSGGKRKMKVKKEEKKLEPAMKKIKQEFNPNENGPVTFMVTCTNHEIAEMAKNHLRRWDEIKSVEWGAPGVPGVPAPPLLHITDDVAVLPQPYL